MKEIQRLRSADGNPIYAPLLVLQFLLNGPMILFELVGCRQQNVGVGVSATLSDLRFVFVALSDRCIVAPKITGIHGLFGSSGLLKHFDLGVIKV